MAGTEVAKIPVQDKKRLVKAVFSYTPVNVDELQLKENDVLEVIEETEEGWWKGILNGNVGMFPSNFVIEISEDMNNVRKNESTPTKNKAKFNSSEVIVTGIKQDSSIFPIIKRDTKASDVSSDSDNINSIPKSLESPSSKVVTNKKSLDSTAPQLPPKPVREQARVIYPYTALNEDELSLKEGDIITVISKEIEDKGWWKGELNNRIGVFPDNFVQLIKLEEQKKPERPNKPSIARLSKPRGKPNDASKTDKNSIKTPPHPPEICKKEVERPPLSSSKKAPTSRPAKQSSCSSVGSQISSFSPPCAVSNTEVACPGTVSTAASNPGDTKLDSPKSSDNKTEKGKDFSFEGLESSCKKLVHLTANRAKAPNRRPPSHIFLRETGKENEHSSDPRRLSEPLLSTMKSLFEDFEPFKNNTIERTDGKSKAPPLRPMPPSLKTAKPVHQGSLRLTKTISSEECIVKAPEPIKKLVLPDVSGIEVSLCGKKEDCPSSDDKSTEAELLDLKNKLRVMMSCSVSKNEYNELLKQVKEVREALDQCQNFCKNSINDLKTELAAEKRHRQALELELLKLKGSQTN